MMNFLFNSVFVDELFKVIHKEIFVIFVVLALGYMLGRITIKNVSLGSSGVFIVALLAGIGLYFLGEQLGFYEIDANGVKSGGWLVNSKGELSGGAVTSSIKDIGLALFVTGIGFISGPTFIRNFKKKAFSFITMGISAVVAGTLVTIIIIKVANLDSGTGAGLMMGALSSTPGLASALNIFEGNNMVAPASGVAYPFGVLGVVLFVQLVPKLLRKDIDVEIAKLKASLGTPDVTQIKTENNEKRFIFDKLGICTFSLAVILGLILGAITIPLGENAKFQLGTTGGALIMGLLFGHFNHIKNVSLEVPKTTLNPMREIGLVLFLTGSGIEGGLKMFSSFGASELIQLLIFGAIITLVPMIVAFLIGKFAFKLELLNNLGAVTGGMTSTPALGALVHTAKTEEVAQAYASTYPVALFILVLIPQLLSII